MSNYSDEFKRDAVQQIRVRGYPVQEVSKRLGVICDFAGAMLSIIAVNWPSGP